METVPFTRLRTTTIAGEGLGRPCVAGAWGLVVHLPFGRDNRGRKGHTEEGVQAKTSSRVVRFAAQAE